MNQCNSCSSYLENLPDHVQEAIVMLPAPLDDAVIQELCSNCSANI